jgi:hypothetical protein
MIKSTIIQGEWLMNKNNIFIPSLENALSTIFIFLSTIICLFINVFITAIFLFSEYFFGFEYFGLISPFTTMYALILWLILLIYPTVKAVSKLMTLFYINEDGDIVRYYINVQNIENFKALASGAVIGAIIDKIIGHGAGGFIASQGLVNIITAIALNTNKEFVLNNIENKDIYVVRKIYKKTENYKIDKVYKNINEYNDSSSVPIIPNLIKYTAIITAILFAINVIFTAVAVGNNTNIKNTYNEIQHNSGQKLYNFGYENISTKPMEFKRQTYNINSDILLYYNYTGKLIKTDINVYWDPSEKSDYILSEIKAIFDILGLNFNESIYKEKVNALQSSEISGHSEKSGNYSIYLTPSSGKINLRIY